MEMVDFAVDVVMLSMSSSRSSERKISPGVACGELLGLQPNNLVVIVVVVAVDGIGDVTNRDEGDDVRGGVFVIMFLLLVRQIMAEGGL